MKTRIFIGAALIFFMNISLTACSPSEEKMQTALAKTLTAMATNTPILTDTPQQTLTPTPTLTLTFTPTLTPTSTYTLTPTPDVRVIVTDPQEFLLKREELPLEGKYYLPNSNWMTLQINSEIIANRGVKEGREYVTNTGRVVGWVKVYARGTRSVRMPDEIYQGIFMYKTAEGAQLAVTKYNNNIYYEPLLGWANLEVDFEWQSRVDSISVQSRQKIAPGGEKQTWYDIQFAYRNFAVDVLGYAYDEKDIDQELLASSAEKILEKFEAAPVVSPEEAEASFTLFENW